MTALKVLARPQQSKPCVTEHEKEQMGARQELLLQLLALFRALLVRRRGGLVVELDVAAAAVVGGGGGGGDERLRLRGLRLLLLLSLPALLPARLLRPRSSCAAAADMLSSASVTDAPLSFFVFLTGRHASLADGSSFFLRRRCGAAFLLRSPRRRGTSRPSLSCARRLKVKRRGRPPSTSTQKNARARKNVKSGHFFVTNVQNCPA